MNTAQRRTLQRRDLVPPLSGEVHHLREELKTSQKKKKALDKCWFQNHDRCQHTSAELKAEPGTDERGALRGTAVSFHLLVRGPFTGDTRFVFSDEVLQAALSESQQTPGTCPLSTPQLVTRT